MSILSTEQVTHHFDEKPILSNLTFHLGKRDRTAIVGANGSGKTTLLKILAGKLSPLKGRIVSERGVRIGYLEQDPSFPPSITLAEFIYSADNEKQQAIRQYEYLLSHKASDVNAITALSERLTEMGAWEYEHEITSILAKLGLNDLEQQIGTLSGGQLKRLALAKLLIDELDVYILDEPTNHLDIETIEWLESYLCNGNKSIVFVTHDRYFLDKVCTRIVELEAGSINNYNGNYNYYLEKKAEKLAALDAAHAKNVNLLRKELEWMRRQPKARSTKSKARINAYHELEEKNQAHKPTSNLQLSLKMARQGGKILEARRLKKSFGSRSVISDFSYVFKKGDRIGLAGRNGSGKSTLLDLLTGTLLPESGVVDPGETTVIGYYKQGGLEFKTTDKMIDVVTEVAEYIYTADGNQLSASQLLTHFLFPPAKQHTRVEKLSGGEKKRLQLMRVLMKNPNFLILDEPSNDLDIDTLNVLEEFLLAFSGVLVLVSHDRYLLDKLTDQLFVLNGNGAVQIFNGNYTDLQLTKQNPVSLQKAETVATRSPNSKHKRTYREQKEFKDLELIIENIESEIRQLTESLHNAGDDSERVLSIASELESRKQLLEGHADRWLELSDLN